MKIYKLIFLSVTLHLFLLSCSDEINKNLIFDITTTAKVENDTLIVKKDSVIEFIFAGNPENIVFFSGEAGHDYKSFNIIEMPSTEIDSCFLRFDAKAVGETGTIENTLSFFISENYNGLIGNNYVLDSTHIKNNTIYSWVDATSACGFPTESGVTKSVKLNMKDYLSKRISLQFKYQTTMNDKAQPAWTISNLKYVLYPKEKVSFEVPASIFGFKSLDIVNKTSAYATAGAGVWNKNTLSNISIASTTAGNPTNEDYLISNPYIMNTITPSKAITIKNTTDNLMSFTYQYAANGIYTLTFVATNIDYNSNSQHQLVSFIVKVL